MSASKTDSIACKPLLIPGRRVDEKYVRFAQEVLSIAECKEWIAFAEAQGFKPASLVPSTSIHSEVDSKEPTMVKNPHRSNDRTLVIDAKRAALLMERLKPFLPPVLTMEATKESPKTNWKLLGLNDHFSFLRYTATERYGRHVDVPYEDESKGVRSFITCQLYLNEGFTGGETRFVQESGYKDFHSRSHLDVVPESGAALLFEHELTHEGCAVTKGTKYTVRIDVLYVKCS